MIGAGHKSCNTGKRGASIDIEFCLAWPTTNQNVVSKQAQINDAGPAYVRPIVLTAVSALILLLRRDSAQARSKQRVEARLSVVVGACWWRSRGPFRRAVCPHDLRLSRRSG